MDYFLTKALLVCFLGFGLTIFASADDTVATPSGVVLSSGVQGGGYWNAGARLQTVATENFHLKVDNLPSTGSVENIEKLLDAQSPVNLAFVQADAAQYYLNLHHDDSKKLDLLDNIGQECVFIVTGIDSGIRTDKDMQDAKDLRMGIANVSSGQAVTFDYMVSQIPEMGDIQVSYGDTLASMQQLNGSNPSVDAVMMVHRPKEHSREVDYALEHSDRYRFVELSDERFTQELWNGRAVYRSMSLAIPGAKTPVKTICVLGLLLANKEKLSLDQRNQLSDLVAYHWMKVYATQQVVP